MVPKKLEDNKNLKFFYQVYYKKIFGNKFLSCLKDFQNFLMGQFQPDINKRFDIFQALEHPWFNNYGKVNFKYYTEIHDNDSIKFLVELQKIEFSPYLNDRLETNVFKG